MMGRPIERFCKRGHDTDAVGRVRHGWCRACAMGDTDRERQRLYHAVVTMREHGNRVASLRLRKLTNRDDAASSWRVRWNVTQSAAVHAANRLFTSAWITVEQADRWCVTLGTHLAIVYPEVYYEPRITHEETALL